MRNKLTAFENSVLAMLKKVPMGRITTYSALAMAVGCPGGARAVGNALNKNPYAPRIPCHRVVRSDGRLGGYAQGVGKKKELLIKEGLRIADDKIVDYRKKMYRFQGKFRK